MISQLPMKHSTDLITIYRNHEQVLIPSTYYITAKIVYKIQYGNEVYIGSSYDIMKRISNHFNGHVNPHTQSRY